MVPGEPLTPAAAKALIVSILDSADGEVLYSAHALDEMAADKITTQDIPSHLRGGVVEPAEFIKGSWRYRVRRARVYVVVAFDTVTRCIVITAWRKKS